jgi:hypothetical protein
LTEREESRGEEYTYTYIRTRTRTRKLTLYVPPQSRLLLENAKATLKREGKSISNFLFEQLESYYRLHEPGNPQQRLDTILKIGKAYHAPGRICGFKDCMRDAIGVALYIPRNEEYGYCSVHSKLIKDNDGLWKVLK